MRLARIALLVSLALLIGGPALAQSPVPPNQWHPYRGSVNCVQVADVNGNFSCSPLVTINPATGQFTTALGTGPITTALGAVVISPTPLTLQALGNDLVIAKSNGAVAPAGPGRGAITFRVRPSPTVPGACQVVAIAGNAFGTAMEFPLAFQNPAYAFLQAPITGALFSDYYVTDIPGGPSGC